MNFLSLDEWPGSSADHTLSSKLAEAILFMCKHGE